MMADDGYEKLCKIKSLLAECMVPPRESKFLNLDRYLEEENGEPFIPDPPQWCNISFRGFQERVLTFRPQYWGADPNATLWFSKYGWRCVEKFVIKCDICISTVECSSLIQKPDLWGDLARKAHDNLCYWSFCPCPDRFIQIITHPKVLCKNVKFNWKKIIAYGVELPKIQTSLLDKMGFTRDILDHLFKVIESASSEEGVSALILVICGWLKSSEDKILECAYCQRHLALRHFISVEDCLEVIPNLRSQEQNALEKRGTESDKSGIETTTTKSDFVLQQRKHPRRSRHPIYRATANHKARLRACITKMKFPSYCNLMKLRYGVSIPPDIRKFQMKRFNRSRQMNKKSSGNETLKIGTDAEGAESNRKLCDNELRTSQKKSSEKKGVPLENICDNTVTNGQKQLLCKDNSVQSNIDSGDSKKKYEVVQEKAATTMGNNGNSKLKEEDVATKLKQGDTTECSKTKKVNVDSEMTDVCTSSLTITDNKAADGRSGTSYENNCSNDRVEETTGTNVSEPSAISLPESRSNDEIDHSAAEKEKRSVEKNGLASDANEKMEVDNIETSPSTRIPCAQTGKRELTRDDEALEEPPNKKIKDSVESPQYKKKNLNPVNEHRFWCIWRIKTVDRHLGSTKEGWRQILDLLRFGVSPQRSELDEQECVDIFEEVKKIHYMMTDW